jgi:hypothetical protein
MSIAAVFVIVFQKFRVYSFLVTKKRKKGIVFSFVCLWMFSQYHYDDYTNDSDEDE